MARVKTVVVRFPWWWRLYLGACVLFGRLGLVEVDPEIAGEFIARHARLTSEPE